MPSKRLPAAAVSVRPRPSRSAAPSSFLTTDRTIDSDVLHIASNNGDAALGSELAVSYPVVEHFYTVQGEGAFSGHAAYFIRLGGCDVGCSWCDTKESWPIDAHPHMEVRDLVSAVREADARTVVITGGEPAMHDLTFLSGALREAGFRVHVETSGAYPLRGNVDWVCLSPKKFKPPVPEIYPLADELKIIIVNRHDLKWAEEHAARVRPGTRLFLQPEWDSPKMIPHVVEYVKAHPEWQISLQVHKILAIP